MSQSFSHLIELRQRILRIVLFFLIFFLGLLQFANPLYQFTAEPLLKFLPANASMIATDVTSPFLTPLKLVFYCSLFVTMPLILQQIWRFVAPALYPPEKFLLAPLLISSIALFYLGILFAYYLVLPLVFSFVVATAPNGVQVMTDINAYLDFIMAIFLAFGFAFQCPIVTCLLVRLQLVDAATLKAKRPYVIVGAFALGMILTPPDVISQTLLAIPLWLLFELGLLISRCLPVKSSSSTTHRLTKSDR